MLTKLLIDEKYMKAVMELIKAAKKEVLVVAYMISLPRLEREGKAKMLCDELVNARKRGCECKVILNYTSPPNRAVEDNKEAAKWMGLNGVEFKYVARNRTVHAKMIIIDGVTLVIGSHNWSQRALERNAEASIEVSENQVVEEAREWFLRIWEEARKMEELP